MLTLTLTLMSIITTSTTSPSIPTIDLAFTEHTHHFARLVQ